MSRGENGNDLLDRLAKGHAGIEGNELVDRLVKGHAEKIEMIWWIDC